MKLLFFDDFRLGVLKGDNVVDVSSVVEEIPRVGPQDVIRGLIERFDEFRASLDAAADGAEGVPVSGVRIRPPLPKPANIDCMAVNYMEDGTRSEPAPINAFTKSPFALITTPWPCGLPPVHCPSKVDCSLLPRFINDHTSFPEPLILPAVQPPDHVTTSRGAGRGFQPLQS